MNDRFKMIDTFACNEWPPTWAAFSWLQERKVAQWWKRHAEALECGGIYPRDTTWGFTTTALEKRITFSSAKAHEQNANE
ncbi:hypothetical protein [Vibrio cholerae]|nr:hypothetical protein [Vibrio cholerae]